MPKLWRYLLFCYLQIFCVSISSFIAILFVSRFKDVARFAAVTADWGKTVLFTAYQLPLILPMTAPIAGFLAALLLLQRLDRHSELTALRSSGIGFRTIFGPLLAASLLLSFCHFAICAEVAPWCRRESRSLLYRETAANPLLFLQRQRLIKIPDLFLRMKVKEEGRAAEDLLVVGYNRASEHLCFLTAEKLEIAGEQFLGERVSFVSPLKDPGLFIENQQSVAMRAPFLTAAIKKNRPSLDATVLSLRMLRIRGEEGGKSGKGAHVEILRRLSLSLSLFTFTLLGFAFGIESSRIPTKKGVVKASLFALGFLVSYLLGRVWKQEYLLSFFAYFLPHAVIWVASGIRLWKMSRGRI